MVKSEPVSITATKKHQPSLSLEVTPAEVSVGEEVTLTATLICPECGPLGGRKIIFQQLTLGIWTKIGEAYTDSDGVATYTKKIKTKGTKKFRAKFNGDESHKGCGSDIEPEGMATILLALLFGGMLLEE